MRRPHCSLPVPRSWWCLLACSSGRLEGGACWDIAGSLPRWQSPNSEPDRVPTAQEPSDKLPVCTSPCCDFSCTGFTDIKVSTFLGSRTEPNAATSMALASSTSTLLLHLRLLTASTRSTTRGPRATNARTIVAQEIIVVPKPTGWLPLLYLWLIRVGCCIEVRF